MDEPLTPYEKGRAEAWLSSVTRNPYERNSQAEREWFVGWQNAKDERIAELENEARFLLARLNELEFSDLEDLHRDFCGHVEPSMSRLSGLLDKP